MLLSGAHGTASVVLTLMAWSFMPDMPQALNGALAEAVWFMQLASL
jgi:hypothetical protein